MKKSFVFLVVSAIMGLCPLYAQNPGNQTNGKQIKTITGTTFDKDLRRKVTASYLAYDQQGRLTNESEPRYYCGCAYTYDSLGRISQKEHICGETSANGYYYYEYTDSSVYLSFEGVIYTETEMIYFNQYGLPSHSLRTMIQHDFDDYVDTTYLSKYYSYTFNQKNQLEEELITETYIGTVDTSVSYDRTTYRYTAFDSIATCIYTDETGDEKRTDYSYDSLTHQKIMIAYTVCEPDQVMLGCYSFESFTYDKDGQILKKEEYLVYPESAEPKLTSVIYYKNGLPAKAEFYDGLEEEKYETIKYKIVYW